MKKIEKVFIFLAILCLSSGPLNVEKSLAQQVKKDAKATSADKNASAKPAPAKTTATKAASSKNDPAKAASSKSGGAKAGDKNTASGKKSKTVSGKADAKSKKSAQPPTAGQSSKKTKSSQAASNKKKSKGRGSSRHDDAPTKEVAQAGKQARLPGPVIASAELFARPVQARVYKMRDSNADWLLPNESPESVGKALAVLKPSLVSNLAFFYNGALPGKDELDSLREIRRKVLQISPNSKFELTLDARDYKSPPEITAHMRALAERLDFELFFFNGLETVYERNPEIALAAIAEAHAQNRLAGAMFNSRVVPQLDYVTIYAGDGVDELQRRISSAQTRLPILATMDNESQKPQLDKNYAGGNDFVTKKTPSERRKLLTLLAKKQDSLGFRLGYPLFFPLQTASKSYDALRDEFMKDTLRRLVDKHNSKPGKIVSTAVLD